MRGKKCKEPYLLQAIQKGKWYGIRQGDLSGR